jgi:hypothetical protein
MRDLFGCVKRRRANRQNKISKYIRVEIMTEMLGLLY